MPDFLWQWSWHNLICLICV